MRYEIQAIRDPLTGLYNRRFLNERFQEEIDRARRYNSPFSVALFHAVPLSLAKQAVALQEGDAILRAVSDNLLAHSRKIDIVARYGNTEFISLLPETTLDGAVKYATNLIEKTALQTVNLSGQNRPLELVGVVMPFQPDRYENYSEFFDQLSAALKKAGPARKLVVESGGQSGQEPCPLQ